MATTTARERILAALKARVETISGLPPFSGQAGRAVFLGEFPGFGPDDPDEALVIMPDSDDIEHQRMNFAIDWPIVIGAVARVGVTNPWMRIERMIGDIKRAVETNDDRRLGLPQDVTTPMKRGATQVFERPEGSNFVGAGITYVVPYVESWGHP